MGAEHHAADGGGSDRGQGEAGRADVSEHLTRMSTRFMYVNVCVKLEMLWLCAAIGPLMISAV